MSSYVFVDMFAGCGGLSLGLLQAKLKGLFAIERDPMAFETLTSNLLQGDGPVDKFCWPEWLNQAPWDIDKLLEDHFNQLVNLRGHVDVLAGGPPCQGFSFAGRRHADDPRNQLFKSYVNVVDAIQPKAIVLENVPGMRVAHSKGNVISLKDRKSPIARVSFYEKLVGRLENIGYSVHAELLNASQFGVPQSRSRLIAIGVRNEVATHLKGGANRAFQLLEEVRRQQFHDLGDKLVTTKRALSDLETQNGELTKCSDPAFGNRFNELKYRKPKALSPYLKLMRESPPAKMDSMRLARHRPDIEKRFARIIDECRKGVRINAEARKTYGTKKLRICPMDPKAPAPTITTLPDDILHYSEPRILTVRESARLQSFPDWFVFKGKYTTGGHRRTKECPRYTQVGNAVPPLLAMAIGTAITKLLDEAEYNLNHQNQVDSAIETREQQKRRVSSR
jgi:DNA (cytosine-5)-methyltransferase 1